MDIKLVEPIYYHNFISATFGDGEIPCQNTDLNKALLQGQNYVFKFIDKCNFCVDENIIKNAICIYVYFRLTMSNSQDVEKFKPWETESYLYLKNSGALLYV